MSATRTRRFVGGVSLGYLQTAIVTITGLWLTPFLLRHLGQHDYGLWLLAAQMLFYLALTDVGIVALLPREVAFATARSGATVSNDLRDLVRETTTLVVWQMPFVALAGLSLWWVVSVRWPALGGPFAIVAFTFVLMFPLRILQAVLQGLQDLTFLGGAQLAAWLAGTTLTVSLVSAGFGMGALAAGWMCTQIVGAALAFWRLTRRFPGVLPAQLSSLTARAARTHLSRGMWISVSQITQVILNGTDILVIGALLGPAAVVTYTCTAKLVTILANQPQLFMQMALPALSELRESSSRARMFEVSRSLSQLLLIASGAIACVVLPVNAPFVSWWVGPERFAAGGLTTLLVIAMLVRHWNIGAIYTLYSCRRERRIAITGTVDGLVGLMSMLLLVPHLGILGAALGSLLGNLTVSVPANLTALAQEESVHVVQALRPLHSWIVRFAMVFLTVLVATAFLPASGLAWGIVRVAVIAMAYGVLMRPVILKPPLGHMLTLRAQPWLVLISTWSRRLAGHPVP